MTITINKRMTINLSICLAALAALALLPLRAEAATYYSQGSVEFTPANFNTVRTGGGSSPANFTTAGDTFIIQDGHNMTRSTTVTFGASSASTLQIESGGKLTADAAITKTGYTTFRIDAGATYVHNNIGTFASTIFNGISDFDTDSTIIFKNAASAPNVDFPSLGNLSLDGDFALSAPALEMRSRLTSVNGTFKVVNTGDKNFYLSSITAYTMTIGGDMIIEGGSLRLTSAGGTVTINLSGSFSQSGGILSGYGSGGGSINFVGSSSANFTHSGGTLTTDDINFTIASTKTLSLNNDLPVATSRSLTVAGTLNCGNNNVTGAGTFTLSAGATLGIGSADGIASSGASGNIQTTTRSFSSSASYTYNGSVAQVTGNGIPATVRNLIIYNGAGVTLSQSVGIGSTYTATVTGTLNCAAYNITGAGAFTLNSGATLGIGSTAGITATGEGLNGNIQVNGTRTFSTSANYTYNGSSAQVTGNGLPATVNNLAINNSAGVTLSQDVTANGGVTMVAGTLKINGKIVTAADLSGAGTIENANATARTLTVNKTSGSSTFAGVVQDGTGGGALALVKQGDGTLLLTGANTYSGATSVDAGTLGGAGSSSSATTVKNNATIAPSTSGSTRGTINTANLTLNSGSIIACEIASPSDLDKVVANGMLALPTGSDKTRIEIPAGSTLTPNTTYDVISYTSVSGGSAANIQVDNYSDTLGVTATLVDNKVRLTTTPEPALGMLAGLALLALRGLKLQA